MAIGFTPTVPSGSAKQVVFVTDRVEVEIVLMEPLFLHAEFEPEFSTYILVLLIDVNAIGLEPGSNEMVVMPPLRVGKYCITVSSPALATNNDSEFVGKASALVPAPIEFTVSTVSPETSISVMLPSLLMPLKLATQA